MTITFTHENAHGIERRYDLPAKWEICDACEGHGTRLHDAIGSHAYSVEEFAESFDDEEREEYFRRGGRYDVSCWECNGLGKVAVLDEEALLRQRHGAKLLAAYEEALDRDARWREEEAHQRRYGY